VVREVFRRRGHGAITGTKHARRGRVVAAIAAVRDARRGDEHVDAAELFDGCVHHGVVVGRARRVGAHEHTASTHGVDVDDGLRAVFLENVGDEDVHPLVGKTKGARPPDAVAAAGDDGDLVGQPAHRYWLCI
jgi:hypothetical protein